MTHLHKRIHLYEGDMVKVDCSHECTILLTDDINYKRFKQGTKFKHYGGGGFFKKLPVTLTAPHDGQWNIILQLSDIHRNAQHHQSITIIQASTLA